VHVDQLLWIGKRQRLEQDGVDDAEHGGVGADAERERQDGRQREAGLPDEGADAVAEVLNESVHAAGIVKGRASENAPEIRDWEGRGTNDVAAARLVRPGAAKLIVLLGEEDVETGERAVAAG